uniref:Uncharacterized protein n=1 Tax=Globodera rostochiensis TaxID=31243 RepID=A0A914GZE9_GLORO
MVPSEQQPLPFPCLWGSVGMGGKTAPAALEESATKQAVFRISANSVVNPLFVAERRCEGVEQSVSCVSRPTAAGDCKLWTNRAIALPNVSDWMILGGLLTTLCEENGAGGGNGTEKEARRKDEGKENGGAGILETMKAKMMTMKTNNNNNKISNSRNRNNTLPPLPLTNGLRHRVHRSQSPSLFGSTKSEIRHRELMPIGWHAFARDQCSNQLTAVVVLLLLSPTDGQQFVEVTPNISQKLSAQ